MSGETSRAPTTSRPPRGLAFRLALRSFPRRFRRAHGPDLVELYDDFAAAGRPLSRWAALWDLLRNGLAARVDDLRPPGAPHPPRLPGSRNRIMDSLWQDIRFAVRMLGKSPTFTAIAVLSLSVGIGASTAVFGVIDAALLRPLAVPEPYELTVLAWRSPAGTELPDVGINGWYQTADNGDGKSSSYSKPAYEAMRDRNDVLTTTFAFAALSQVNVNHGNESELVDGQVVSGNYYAALGVDAALGRLIVAGDDRVDAESVVVLSHGYWQRRFGADPAIVGETVRINNNPFVVIGVTPAGFRGTLQVGDNPEITVPLAQQPLVSTSSRDRTLPDYWWLHVMGRLRPGVDRAAAGEQLDALFHQSVEADLFPQGVPEQYTLPTVELRPGFQGMTERRGNLRTPLRVMGAVVALVLLIACVNVANLLMARAATRRREIAVRLSIGAGRWRVMRQLLAESVVLSCVAGALGVALAAWGREALIGVMSTRDLYIEGVRTDARVLAFGVAASLLTGVLFGTVPAWRASRPDLTPALKDGAGDASWHGGAWSLRALLVSQVAMSVPLLVVAGLFVRTLLNLEAEATGFDPRGVAVMRVNPGLMGYFGEREVAYYDDVQRRLRQIPGVTAATITAHSPVSDRISLTGLKVPGYEPAEGERMYAFPNLVAPEFFATFDIPLLAGRGIEARDRDGAAMVTVVNEQFAERFFPGESPIGRRIGLGRDGDPDEYEIIGVSANVKYQQLSDQQYPVAHVALAQHAGSSPLDPMTLALRSTGDVAEAIAAARAVVRQVDPNIPVFAARTLSAQQAETLDSERLFARMSLVLGTLALGLACIGLYGVLSYNVARRTREIGVRMALGARTADVVRLVMREMGAVLAGVGIGLIVARLTTGYLESLMYELSTTDPATYALAVGVLLAVAAIAAYLPGRRAAAVDPIVALRSE